MSDAVVVGNKVQIPEVKEYAYEDLERKIMNLTREVELRQRRIDEATTELADFTAKLAGWQKILDDAKLAGLKKTVEILPK